MYNFLIFYSFKSKSSLLVTNELIKHSIFNKSYTHDISSPYIFNKLNINEILFVATTAGDSELTSTFESFLVNTDWSNFLRRKFSIIEIGIYNGLDNTSFGSAKIIELYLSSKHLTYSRNVLSIDSYRNPDITLLNRWVNKNFAYD